jgi:predicted glycoside hydrolase/deacetylase ChbG (UPF0249 family)
MSLPLISADDWGLSPGINEGILDLAQRRIVRRVSILASGSYTRYGLPDLMNLPALSLGLHFSLTFGRTDLNGEIQILASGGQFHLSPIRLSILYLTAGPSRRKRIEEEVNLLLREQLTKLKNEAICPSYLDGHHHIHLLPGIMESILPVLREAGITQVRVPSDSARLFSRVSPVVILAWRARFKWPKWGVVFLPCVYPAARDYRDATFLRRIVKKRGGYEMVVHPAARDDVPELKIPDHYIGSRVKEYEVLRSLEDLFSSEIP